MFLVEPAECGLTERPLFTVDGPALRLLDNPDPTALAIAIGQLDRDVSAIWRILPTTPWQQLVAEIPGVLAGGHWLDERGRRLVVNQHVEGETRPVVVDLRHARVEPLAHLTAGEHVLLTGPRSGLVVVAGNVSGDFTLGHTRAGSSGPPTFPEHLHSVSGSVAPLAVDPSGEHIALRVDRGARSHLYVYTPDWEEIKEIPVPAGVISGSGRWTQQGLTFPFSTSTRPTEIATVRPDGDRRWCVTGDASNHTAWIGASVRDFPGPAGPIEAVVYGEDWRDAEKVLLLLHGGPEAATRVGFDPLVQAFASSGITVIAPNYRGSIGYGRAHSQAIHHAWGGPDLADVRAVAQHVRHGRRRPGTLMLFGESYGAFLALLAASAEPALWSHCVAVAPFVSAPSLYAEGSVGVRSLIDRLGGCTVVDDYLGPRDLSRLCDRISAWLLLIHGGNDEVIPVGQSRALRAHLVRAGRREGRDFTYLEPPTGGHYPLEGTGGTVAHHRILQFLLGTQPRADAMTTAS